MSRRKSEALCTQTPTVTREKTPQLSLYQLQVNFSPCPILVDKLQVLLIVINIIPFLFSATIAVEGEWGGCRSSQFPQC